MYPDPVDVLRDYWGYPSFRPQQEDIVRSVLLGNDTLALMPTGGGKSICFQVPALAKEGICVVISPLIALMKDQVDRLRSMDIRSAYLSSMQRYHEMDNILDSAVYGKMKFLYVSPERLKNELFLERFKRMKVNLIAVDEAHCISQWGHDFRPAYREIAAIRAYHPEVPVLAVTASATPEVAKDIAEQLALRNPAVFELPMTRSNLNYVALEEREPLGRLLRICKRLGGSGIVYAGTRRAVRKTAEYLSSHGIASAYYHAGLDGDSKEKLQNDWIQGKFPVMVATNAFGMGIDKPDVRFVVHTTPPQNMENYVQEAGRAGRDGEESWAILMWNTEMVEMIRKQLADGFPSKERVSAIYQHLCSHFSIAFGAGLESTHDFVMGDFVRTYDYDAREVLSALEILSASGYITLSEGMVVPSRVMVRMSHKALYDFQVRNPQLDSFIRLLLRTYGGMFEAHTRIDEHFLARQTGWGTSQVKDTLAGLHRMEVIDYRPRSNSPSVTFLTGRQRDQLLPITREAYELRQERSLGRFDSMLEYLHLEACRSRFIANYFGDLEAIECGHCDWCRKQNIPAYNVYESLMKRLQSKPASLADLIDALSPIPREEVITQVNLSLDEGEVFRDEDDLLHWREVEKD